MAHVEVHAPMEPPEPEAPTEAQIPDEAFDQVRHHPAPKIQLKKKQRYLIHNNYL